MVDEVKWSKLVAQPINDALSSRSVGEIDRRFARMFAKKLRTQKLGTSSSLSTYSSKGLAAQLRLRAR